MRIVSFSTVPNRKHQFQKCRSFIKTQRTAAITTPKYSRRFFFENNPLIFQLFNRKRIIKDSTTGKMMTNKSISISCISIHCLKNIITSKLTVS